MSSLFNTGSGPIASIVNYFSAGGTSAANLTASALSNTKETTSGALTANTLFARHSLTGRGRLNLLTVYAKDSTSRTIRAVVIVDGVTVFDATTNAITVSGTGTCPVGTVTADGSLVFQPIDFQSSLVIQIASSLTETDKIATGINYETWS